MTDYKNKKMIIFDLDGTLALSKSAIDDEMHTLLEQLLEKKDVLVISGGQWRQFKKQLIDRLTLSPSQLSRLFIAPGGGSAMYRFEEGEVREMYGDFLSKEEKQRIFNAYDYALPKAGFVPPEHPHGAIIEDRGSEITFSALGQEAPLSEKDAWDPTHEKREKIIAFLKEKIPDLEVHMGGTTSIDIVKKGEDKSYGIQKASERLGIPISEMLYVGDALYPGGNDEPAIKSGVETHQVKDVEATKELIREILKS